MNRKEATRQTHQQDTLRSLGFSNEEADKLRRISMTLRRWHELECGTDGGCSAGGCGTDGCGTDGCGTDGCGTDGCRTDGCGTGGCSTDGCMAG